MRISAAPIKPSTRHIRVDQRRAVGSAPGTSPDAPNPLAEKLAV
jgi:hypothetical protein